VAATIQIRFLLLIVPETLQNGALTTYGGIHGAGLLMVSFDSDSAFDIVTSGKRSSFQFFTGNT
jgi:hypothetical protein